MNLTLKLIWQLHRLNLRGLSFRPTYATPEHYKELMDHLGKDEFDKHFPLGKEKIEITQHNNCTIVDLINFPRICGKTTFLMDTLNNVVYPEKSLFLTTNTGYAQRLKEIFKVGGDYCYFDSLENFFKRKQLGVRYQHFFVDEFVIANGWDKTNKKWKSAGALKISYNKTLSLMMSMIENPNKPSYIIFVH